MKTVLLLFTFLFGLQANAQPPKRFYTKFGGEGIDIGYSVKETFNKQSIIIGSTTSSGAGSTDAYLVLVDSAGQPLWQKNFGGVGADVGKALVVNPSDSGFIFTGYTNSFGVGGFDIYAARTDKNGNLIWQTSFGGLDWDFGNDLTIASDGNIIICGSSYSGNYGKIDGVILKLNSINGAKTWHKYYGGSEDDEFNVIKKTSDGNYSVAGNTKSYGDIQNDFWFFRLNLSGDSLTSKNFGSSNKKERCYDFIEDNNANLVFCGSYDTSFYNIGKNISYMIKTDLNCTFINENKAPGGFTPDDKFHSVSTRKSGNYYFLSRKVYNGGALEIDVQPFLMDYNYSFFGATTYGDSKDDECFKTICTSDGGFLMVGYTKGSTSLSEDVLLIKLDSTLLNTPKVVGMISHNNKITETNMYYYANSVYFENFLNEELAFQLIDSKGGIILDGSTRENFITFNSGLANDIYFFRIQGRKSSKIKFIKN